MQVILREDVDGLGSRGDVVTVADGYFRNFLHPRGLGYKATKGAEVEAEAMRKASAAQNEANRAEADKVCLLYTSPSPRDATLSRMPSSA